MPDQDPPTQATGLPREQAKDTDGEVLRSPKPFQTSGSVGTSADTINFTSRTRSILFVNTHASNSLLVNVDAGNASEFLTITTADKSATLNTGVLSCQIKGSASGTTYELVATLEDAS